MKPKVSVIIPTYNTASYISQAIESALRQTLENIEVIVVDDASTDNTLAVVKKFSDPRLKVFANQQNLGVSGARNHALKVAQGEWIAVLDSDDWYAPDRLEKLIIIATAENADIVIDDLNLIQDNHTSPWSTLLQESGEEILGLKKIDPVYFIKSDVYGQKGLHLGISKPIFKREFLVKNNINYMENIRFAEDFQFTLQCLIDGAYCVFVPQAYYFYLLRPGSSITQNKIDQINQATRVIQGFLQRENVQSNRILLDALSQNLVVLEKNKAYYSVVEPIKQKKLLIALKKAISHPYFFVHFVSQIQAILWRKLKYHILGDKSVYQLSALKRN